MQKSFISIVLSAIISFLFLLIVPAQSLAQTTGTLSGTKTPVSFHVEVGNLICKGGVGTASVLFVTEPKAGGYFEIIGGAIDQNGMTLDRRISLKSGTYTWKGSVNEGYREIPPSIGEFTIPICGTSSPASLTPASKTQPTRVLPAAKETQKTIDEKEGSMSSTSTTTASSSENTENTAPEENQSGTFKIIILGLVILGVVFAVFGRKNTDKK